MPKCKHGCGYEAARNVLNLHESMHCPKLKKKGKKQAHVCTFRLLSPKVAAERQAIAAGYEEICDECEEVQ